MRRNSSQSASRSRTGLGAGDSGSRKTQMASVDVTVRAATLDDSDSIAGLVDSLGYPTTAVEMSNRLEPILSDANAATLVACDDGQIVGFVGTRVGRFYESDGYYGQIMALAVTSEYQRHGNGRILLRAAESAMIERGARVLVVNSGNQRADAHAFYERNGYEFTGRRYKKVSTIVNARGTQSG